MKYKHKQTGVFVDLVELNYATKFYRPNTGVVNHECIPAWVVENSEDWEKVEEESLLTTEDGVEIFNKKQDLYSVNITNWITGNTCIAAWALPDGGREYGWRFFSTKEKRLEYIANTRNLFTIEEVVGLRYHTQGEILEKAKKKLKANDSNL